MVVGVGKWPMGEVVMSSTMVGSSMASPMFWKVLIVGGRYLIGQIGSSHRATVKFLAVGCI